MSDVASKGDADLLAELRAIDADPHGSPSMDALATKLRVRGITADALARGGLKHMAEAFFKLMDNEAYRAKLSLVVAEGQRDEAQAEVERLKEENKRMLAVVSAAREVCSDMRWDENVPICCATMLVNALRDLDEGTIE